jgi:hypothetical protein
VSVPVPQNSPPPTPSCFPMMTSLSSMTSLSPGVAFKRRTDFHWSQPWTMLRSLPFSGIRMLLCEIVSSAYFTRNPDCKTANSGVCCVHHCIMRIHVLCCHCCTVCTLNRYSPDEISNIFSNIQTQAVSCR